MLTSRPPPLQLRLDNTLPNLGIRPPKSLYTRLYETNWRAVVIALAIVNALRFALQANNAFHDEDIDTEQHFPGLARISFTLGVMYITVCAIETYGLFSSILLRPSLIRIYTVLAFFSAMLVTAAGMINAVSYFVLADDLIAECVALSKEGRMNARSLFRSDAWRHTLLPIPGKLAATQCLSTFNSESTTAILSIILFSLIPSTICFLVVWTWGRQIRDPNHAAYVVEPCGCCFGAGGGGVRRHGGRSAIVMEEYSPIYHGQTPHSHHSMTQQPQHQPVTVQVKKQKQKLNAVRAVVPVAASSSSQAPVSIPVAPPVRKAPPPALTGIPEIHAPVVPPMPETRQAAYAVSMPGEDFQTMSPFALESPSPSPYGVSPGPPSYAGGYEGDYVYDYGPEGYDEQYAHETWAQAEQQQVQEPVQDPAPVRGRGEYWFV